MARISVTNLTRRRDIDSNFVKKAVNQTLLGEGIAGDVSLSVVFVGIKKIRSLNLKYNLTNAPTDVLSFGQSKEFPSKEDYAEFLGEIFLCPEIISKNAARVKATFQKELAHAIIHGVLHLLGHDHEDSEEKRLLMHKLEEDIMNSRLRLKIKD